MHIFLKVELLHIQAYSYDSAANKSKNQICKQTLHLQSHLKKQKQNAQTIYI